MRELNKSYVFDKTAGTITLGGGGIEQEAILGIWNITRGVKLYDPHTTGYGGTVATNVLTLVDVDTSAMDNADKLLIFQEGELLASIDKNTSLTSSYLGALDDGVPHADTEPSAINGRLQRIAQHLTSLLDVLPVALGAGDGLKVDGSGTPLPVSASALPLPAGAATEAKQDAQVVLFGAKTTSVTALETGGSGVIGWLSQIWRDIKSGVVLQAGANVIGKVSIDQTTPGTTNAVEVTKLPKSSSATNSGVITSATTVLSSNTSRKNWQIQNLGTNPLYVRLGASATTSSGGYNFILQPGTANDDGKGGSFWDDTYTGVVSVAGTSPRCVGSEW